MKIKCGIRRFVALCMVLMLCLTGAVSAETTAEATSTETSVASAPEVDAGNGVVLYPEWNEEWRKYEDAHLPEILRTSPAPGVDTSDGDFDVSWVTEHVYTGQKVTPIPEELKELNTRGGVKLEPNSGSWDFSREGGVTYGSNRNVAQFKWMDLGDGSGCYRYYISQANRWSQSIYSSTTNSTAYDAKPNRNYLVSLLLWTDWTIIAADGETREALVNLAMGDRDPDPGSAGVGMRMGLPPYTNGWVRFEYVCSPGLMGIEGFFPLLQTWNFDFGVDDNMICIADFSIVELPEETNYPIYKEGEGVTFRGTAGALDMKVEDAVETEDTITVTTTGTKYIFDKKNSTISAHQRINLKREVSSWKSNVSFANLKIRSKTDTECVISCPDVTFGVQMDGIVFLTPHNGDIRLECTSKISGIWNRFDWGFLTCIDDYGGFTVTPDLPEGTGKLCNYEVITENLDFVDIPFDNAKRLIDGKYMHPHWNEVSNVKAGWQIAWTISPGERLAISTFPPREYDWKKSFNMTYENKDWTSGNDYARRLNDFNVKVATIFNASDRAYAIEWTPFTTYNAHEAGFIRQIENAKAAGVEPITYLPQYFYFNKYTPDSYVANVKRIKERYGIEGIYSDGNSSEHQWVTAYESARMLRQMFDDGTMIIHTTGITDNGGAPISSPGHYVPGIDTYWSGTLKTETLNYADITPPLIQYTVSQYNTSNIVGYAKGDAWKYLDENGELQTLPAHYWSLIMLEQNGRARIEGANDYFRGAYVNYLRQLEALWEEKGDDPFFYEKYFAPKVRELIKPDMEHFGDMVELDIDFSTENILDEIGIYNVDAKTKTEGEATYMELRGPRSYDKGSVLKRIAALAGEVDVEYKFKITERGDFEHGFTDNYGNIGAEIMFGSDGKIKVKNFAGNYVNIGTYERNKWYDVRININTDTDKYSLYLNDTLVKADIALSSDFHYFSELEFTGGGYGSVCCLDDIRVLNKW